MHRVLGQQRELVRLVRARVLQKSLFSLRITQLEQTRRDSSQNDAGDSGSRRYHVASRQHTESYLYRADFVFVVSQNLVRRWVNLLAGSSRVTFFCTTKIRKSQHPLQRDSCIGDWKPANKKSGKVFKTLSLLYVLVGKQTKLVRVRRLRHFVVVRPWSVF